MHTDEYEISLGREVSLCRRMIKRLRDALSEREKQYGMTTEAFFAVLEEGRSAGESRIFRSWQEDHKELQIWQQRLSDYEKVLQSLKGI
jgi:hypothetical protein